MEDAERRVQLMRHARAKQAKTGEPILLFESVEGPRQIVFALAELSDRCIARTHNLADLVARDQRLINQLAIPVAVLGSTVGVEHQANRSIDVYRHDIELEQQYRKDIEDPQDHEQRDVGP